MSGGPAKARQISRMVQAQSNKGRLEAVKPLAFGWAIFEWASCIIVQQGLCLSSCPTSSSPNLHFNQPSGHWPCVKFYLVGGSNKYGQISRIRHVICHQVKILFLIVSQIITSYNPFFIFVSGCCFWCLCLSTIWSFNIPSMLWNYCL